MYKAGKKYMWFSLLLKWIILLLFYHQAYNRVQVRKPTTIEKGSEWRGYTESERTSAPLLQRERKFVSIPQHSHQLPSLPPLSCSLVPPTAVSAQHWAQLLYSPPVALITRLRWLQERDVPKFLINTNESFPRLDWHLNIDLQETQQTYKRFVGGVLKQ